MFKALLSPSLMIKHGNSQNSLEKKHATCFSTDETYLFNRPAKFEGQQTQKSNVEMWMKQTIQFSLDQ